MGVVPVNDDQGTELPDETQVVEGDLDRLAVEPGDGVRTDLADLIHRDPFLCGGLALLACPGEYILRHRWTQVKHLFQIFSEISVCPGHRPFLGNVVHDLTWVKGCETMTS